jgi:hypothetical protein
MNLSAASFVSSVPIDKVIGIVTGTVSVGAPSSGAPDFGTKSATDTRAHGFGDNCYFQGIFSTDNGTTWNDFGCMTPNLTSANPVFQTLDTNATVDTTNVTVKVTNYYDSVHSTSTAYTVLYKVFLLAKPNMAQPVTPIAVSEPASLNSQFKYQKIFAQDKLNLTVAFGSSGSVSVAHNLGYIPNVRAWWFDGGSPTVCRPISFSPGNTTGTGVDSPQVQIDTSRVTFFSDQRNGFSVGINGTIGYTIYYAN